MNLIPQDMRSTHTEMNRGGGGGARSPSPRRSRRSPSPPTRRSRSRDRDRGGWYPNRRDHHQQPHHYGGPAYGSGDADFLER